MDIFSNCPVTLRARSPNIEAKSPVLSTKPEATPYELISLGYTCISRVWAAKTRPGTQTRLKPTQRFDTRAWRGWGFGMSSIMRSNLA